MTTSVLPSAARILERCDALARCSEQADALTRVLATLEKLLTGTAPPGTAEPSLVVRVRVPDPAAVDTKRLDRVVSASKPAHVPHTVEVIKS